MYISEKGYYYKEEKNKKIRISKEEFEKLVSFLNEPMKEKITINNLNNVSNNSYIYIGHGNKIKETDYITLNNNQSVILLCNNNEKYYPRNNNQGAWDYLFYKKPLSLDSIKNRLITKDKNNMCLFTKKVPNLYLYSYSFEKDKKYFKNGIKWRSGLYKIPLKIKIRDNSSKISINDISCITKKIDIIEKYKSIHTLKDIILKFGNKPFTLYLFVCRN